jgi:hypothetical protein
VQLQVHEDGEHVIVIVAITLRDYFSVATAAERLNSAEPIFESIFSSPSESATMTTDFSDRRESELRASRAARDFEFARG